MNQIRELIHAAINTFLHNPNQFASGGLFLMAIGAIGALLRKIPNDIWKWFVHQTTITLSITDDERVYHWLKAWIENQQIMRRVRHMDVINKGSEKYAILPAPGHHWMLYKGRIISVTFTRTEEKKMGQTTRSETVLLKTIGRKQTLFRNMIAEVHADFVKQEEKKPELHAWGQWGEWRQIHNYMPRPIESVIMPVGDKERLIKDIETFRANRNWYTEMGIPYRKGYLFYGPPGTGKTSLVTGLSSYFKSNIYMLKLSDMSDASLREAITGVEANSFFVIEDIDCINASHKRTKAKDDKKSGVTLSGLLNVIDGLFSPPGAIFVMTTNHKEKLDPALIRPGRVDLQLNITHATSDQKKALYRRFFQTGECPEKYLNKTLTMAELQQKLMEEKAGVSKCPRRPDP